MGAQIAAHLANAGVPTLLLDIPPRELTPEEQAKGLTLDRPQVRNRIARSGLEAAKKAKPAAFFTPDFASLVTPGNFDDDLAKTQRLRSDHRSGRREPGHQALALRAGRTTSKTGFDRRFKHQRHSDSLARRRSF